MNLLPILTNGLVIDVAEQFKLLKTAASDWATENSKRGFTAHLKGESSGQNQSLQIWSRIAYAPREYGLHYSEHFNLPLALICRVITTCSPSKLLPTGMIRV